MKRTEWLQETRRMRFEEAYEGWRVRRLTQEEAARLPGVHERTFRRYIDRYEEGGLEELMDKRLEQVSHRQAPVDEVMRLTTRYRSQYLGWNVKHFHAWYRREGGVRSYSWVKNRLQEAGLVSRAAGRGKHRKRRERAPLPAMMLHQDGSTHPWVSGRQWDLIVTMDDATNEHYSMFFVEEEGTASSFRGVREVIEGRGLFSSLYTDRGSHYWHPPGAGGKVDKEHLTPLGGRCGSSASRGSRPTPPRPADARSAPEGTHQARLPKELCLAGILDMEVANRYLREVYLPAYNAEFRQPAAEDGSAFVPLIGQDITDILCEHFERTVGKDNRVSFEGKQLQIPADRHRMRYVKVKVRVHRYPDGRLARFHGPRRLADYDAKGRVLLPSMKAAA